MKDSRVHRLICLLLAVVVSSLSASPPIALADNSTRDFSVLYVGEYGDEDASAIRSRLINDGWRQEVYKTSKGSTASSMPWHYHFTHGPNDNLVDAADDSDLLYVSGHGWHRAEIPIYRKTSFPSGAPQQTGENISPDQTCNNSAKWEVGFEWKGLWPSNESRWDHDIEWAVFAACSQLNNDKSIPAYGTSDSAAKAWARTLLGSPNRMHSILGYWGTAPAGSADTGIANHFMDHTLIHNRTVLTSWRMANEYWGGRWACVTHTENVNDRLHGHGTVTPDTHPQSLYTIDYYKAGLHGRILDGRGGSYETVGSLDNHPNSLFRFLARALEVEPAYASASDYVSAVFPGKHGNTIARLQSDGANASLPALKVKPHVTDPAESLNSRVVRSGIKDVRGVRVSFVEGSARGTEGTETALAWPDGRFEYHSGRALQSSKVGMTAEEAIRSVKTQLLEAGQLPWDAEVAEVFAVEKTQLGLDDEQDGKPEIVQYGVRFIQKVNGVYIEGPGVGMYVTVDDSGVCDIYRRWYRSSSADEVGGAVTPLDPFVSVSNLAANRGKATKAAGDVNIVELDIVYSPTEGSDALVPAWRAEMEDGSAVYIDAASGEVLSALEEPSTP